MSDCTVCIGSGDYDGTSEFHHNEIRHARKEHRCCECKRIINVGESYEHVFGKWDGDTFTQKTCDYCHEIRDAFNCGGSYIFGELWSEMNAYVFPVMTLGCFERLSTAGAKTYLRLMWMQWKGLVKEEQHGEDCA